MTFFFYDLETSGLNPRTQRIMQFAGQRTDASLQPIGAPINILVRLSDDILPDPRAIMVTGITPQQTLADGMTEPEFCRFLYDDVFLPDTTILGYNTIRFDDEFVRHTLWRNFYDPYAWSYEDGRSRWDMLDVVRMTRALRPDGIEWPVDANGRATNRLELLATANGLLHTKAHDALSDVEVLIALTRRIKDAQPKLFDYLLNIRSKQAVAKLVDAKNPSMFVYTSGRYGADYDFTTIAYPIGSGTHPNSVLVYDLRYDPSQFIGATPEALASVLSARRDPHTRENTPPLPIKELSYSRCPAVAPVGVLDGASQERLDIEMSTLTMHRQVLIDHPEFAAVAKTAMEINSTYEPSVDVESQLYDGFIPRTDMVTCAAVRSATTQELTGFDPRFTDTRLSELLIRYKARWYPQSMSGHERDVWDVYRSQKIIAGLPSYLETLRQIATTTKDTYVLEELQLWAESIVPSDD